MASDRDAEGPPLVVVAMGGVGVVLAVLKAAELWLRPDPFGPAFLVGFLSGLPFLGLLFVAVYGLDRCALSAGRYRRVGGLFVAGTASFLAMFALIAVLMFDATLDQLATVRWGVTLGAGGSAFVALLEARAIDHAAHADHAASRAAELDRQRRLLGYLNRFLRHEVLNAITVIEGYAEDLTDALEDGTPAAAQAAVIREETEELTGIVRDVRLLLTAADGHDTFEPVALVPVLEAEIDRLAERHDGVAIDLDAPDAVVVLADDLVRRIVSNLLQNAVEHNPADVARVSVGVSTTDEWATVRIADNGPGIPDAARDVLFEPTRRGDHGLGLSIARTLAERYGGRLELADTGPDGSVFTVSLPRVRPAAGPPA